MFSFFIYLKSSVLWICAPSFPFQNGIWTPFSLFHWCFLKHLFSLFIYMKYSVLWICASYQIVISNQLFSNWSFFWLKMINDCESKDKWTGDNLKGNPSESRYIIVTWNDWFFDVFLNPLFRLFLMPKNLLCEIVEYRFVCFIESKRVVGNSAQRVRKYC